MAGPDASPDGRDRLLGAVAAAVEQLQRRAQEINDINVFPVADGDTGTNMLLTARAIEEAARASLGASSRDRGQAIARAALLGARGNSGMILSQMVRGAVDALADHPALDGPGLAGALRRASDTAYGCVRDPVEGTMLTVIRAMAEGAESAAGAGRQDVLDAALDAGRRALAATRDQLPQLAEAGVVDSGGLAVVLILEGLATSVSGHSAGFTTSGPAPAPALTAAEHAPSGFRFCTSFVVRMATIELSDLEEDLTPLGDSLLVMGDRREAKVHLHTDEPDRAIGLAGAVAVVSDVNVDDMHRQEEARAERLVRRATATPGALAGAPDPSTPLDAERTALITDSASDLPPELRGGNVVVVPVPVSFGTESFRDGVDLDSDAFYARLTAGGAMPTTAAPALGELVEAYTRALERFDTAVVLHMNRKMSATVEIARHAALEVDPARIAIIETESISFQLGLLVRRAGAHLERGTTLGRLQELVELFRRSQGTVFTVETLEYLRRGGRIGRARALVGNLLGLRPVLEIAEGEVRPYRRVRGAEQALSAMGELLADRSDPERPLRVALAHARAPEAIPPLMALVEEVRPLAVVDLVTAIGPTVGTHAGPGASAVSFFHDPLDERAAEGGG